MRQSAVGSIGRGILWVYCRYCTVGTPAELSLVLHEYRYEYEYGASGVIIPYQQGGAPALRTGIVPVQLLISMHASFSPYTLPKKVIRCALTPFFWKGKSKNCTPKEINSSSRNRCIHRDICPKYI